MQFGCRERRGLAPILDDSLVLVRKRTVVVHKRVLNSSKAREDANQIKAKGVAAELFRKELIKAPFRRLQIHSRLRELRQFVHVFQSSSTRCPASVIVIRTTSNMRPPPIMCSDVAVTSPEMHRSIICSTVKPCTSMIASVAPLREDASSSSARQRLGRGPWRDGKAGRVRNR